MVSSPHEPTFSFIITCIGVDECKVTFEPEGARHVLRADDIFRVDITSPSAPQIEVAYRPGGIAIVESTGAAITVRNRDGVDLPI
jgi:hypothetical protein